MSSDPGDPDDEAAALRARLDRLYGRPERSGRFAPLRAEADAQNGRERHRLGDVARLARRQRVRLGGDPRVGDRLGSRPRAPHKSRVSHCIFLDRRSGGDLERDPADIAKTVTLNRNSRLSRANSPDKDVRRSASRAERDASLGGAELLAGRRFEPRNEADDDGD